MPKTQPTNPVVPPASQDGLQTMPQGVGQKVSRNRARARIAKSETTEAIVPTSSVFTQICSTASEGVETTAGVIGPKYREALEVRANRIDRDFTTREGIGLDGPYYEPIDFQIETNLPIPVAETARQWLRSKNLIWASNDRAFWQALEYVLGSLESFSIDAVEQALIICTTEAADNPTRRTAIYQELRACRAIKKVRDLSLRIRTAQVVAERALSAPMLVQLKKECWQREKEANQIRMEQLRLGEDGERRIQEMVLELECRHLDDSIGRDIYFRFSQEKITLAEALEEVKRCWL